jgi:serine/threonine protein kinase
MTPDQYRRMSELFDQLRELPEHRHAAALDAACAGDAELRAQVLRLLAADRQANSGSFLNRRALEDATRLITPPAQTPPDLPCPGMVVGNYRLGARIGAGGMGIVYEAEDLRLHRRVAVKVLPPPLEAEAEERILRFQREARASSQLNHPNIVSIFDAGFDHGCYYIAMEFVEGKTLRTLIATESRTIDYKTVLDWVGQTASALTAAHGAGIVHRDIKPENIMVRPDGFVKVLDFGLASIQERSTDASSNLLTRPGHVAGTIQYLSPEQAIGKPAGERSDLFSLGVVAYELATGVRPFDGPTDGAVFDAILNRTPPPPSSIRPSLGGELDAMILQSLEKDPELRFQTASDLRSCCKRLTRDSPRPVVVPLLRRALPKPGSAQLYAKVAVGLAFAILLAICARLYLSLPGRSQPKRATSQITVISALPGFQLDPRVSPDARKLAFVWNGDGDNYDIYVKTIGEQTPRRLTTNEAEDLHPAWSPDGSQIAFLRASPTKKEIFVVPADGGPERKIAEIKPLAALWRKDVDYIRVFAPGPDWSPDGRWLAVSDRCSDTSSSDCVFLLSLDGLEKRRITAGAPIGDYAPTFSPDGKRIAFLRTSTEWGAAEIFTEARNGSSERRLTSDGQMILSLAWVNGRIFFVSNPNANNPVLRSISDTGGVSQSVSGVGFQVFAVSAASRVSELALAREYDNWNVWRTNLAATGRQSSVLIGSWRANHSAQYSPDGSQIVFVSTRSGGEEIWVARSDGSNSRRITVSSTFRGIGSPNWSPDGKQFVYDSVISDHSQVCLMNVDGTNQTQLTTELDGAMMPTWSRDGRSIYYVVRRQDALSIWKRLVGGGSAVHIADDVFSEGLESPDGRRVFFSRRTPGIWEAPSSGGDAHLIPELAGIVDSRHFFVSRTGIYFMKQEVPPWEIRYFDFANRQVTSVTNISRTPMLFTHSLSVSPDGKWMLHAQMDQVGSEIALLSDPQ